MKNQWIPAIGLAATIAVCGYMAARLNADRDEQLHNGSAPPAIVQPVADSPAQSR
jgi:hypothetical protein